MEHRNELEEWFQLAFEYSKIGMMLSSNNGCFIKVNETLCEMMGYTKQELLSKRFTEVIHPDDLNDAIDIFSKVIQGKVKSYQAERRYLHKTNRVIWMSITGSVVLDSNNQVRMIISQFQDITHSKIREQELKKWATIFQYAGWGIAILEPSEKTMILMNQKFAEMNGIPMTELMNQPIYNRVAPECKMYAKRQFEKLYHLRQDTFELRLLSQIRKGEFKRYQALIDATMVMNDHDKIHYLVINVRDISHLKKVERQLKKTIDEKEALIHEIHHRVKNNLGVMISLLSLQKNSAINHETIQFINVSISRLTSMAINHELLYQSDNFVNIDYKTYIDKLIQNIRIMFDTDMKRIHFQVDLSPIYLPIYIAVPCGLLINEIITNSIKHAFPNSQEGCIYVVSQETADFYHIKIGDNGVGLPQEFNMLNNQSLGMQLIQSLPLQFLGTIQSDQSQGLHYTINIPKI